MPLCLETEVTADALRYRVRGSWRTVALSEIETAEVIAFQQKSWPLSVNTGPTGIRVTSTSGRGVALSLRGGKKLLLGSAGPERLLAALKTGTGVAALCDEEAVRQVCIGHNVGCDTTLNYTSRIQEKNLNALRSIQSRILFYSFHSEKQISWEIYFSKPYE